MTDTKPSPLTAAELCEIGERARENCRGLAVDDRARLFAALERLIKAYTIESRDGKCAYLDSLGDPKFVDTKDAAIDALLSQGGGE